MMRRLSSLKLLIYRCRNRRHFAAGVRISATDSPAPPISARRTVARTEETTLAQHLFR